MIKHLSFSNNVHNHVGVDDALVYVSIAENADNGTLQREFNVEPGFDVIWDTGAPIGLSVVLGLVTILCEVPTKISYKFNSDTIYFNVEDGQVKMYNIWDTNNETIPLFSTHGNAGAFISGTLTISKNFSISDDFGNKIPTNLVFSPVKPTQVPIEFVMPCSNVRINLT